MNVSLNILLSENVNVGKYIIGLEYKIKFSMQSIEYDRILKEIYVIVHQKMLDKKPKSLNLTIFPCKV